MILRAKIDMARPTSTCATRDLPHPLRRAPHDGRRVEGLPDVRYAHPIEDALENITHSICTLEFEDQRPFYDWTLERIVPLLRTPSTRPHAPRWKRSATPAQKPSASSRSTAATWPRKGPTSSR